MRQQSMEHLSPPGKLTRPSTCARQGVGASARPLLAENSGRSIGRDSDPCRDGTAEAPCAPAPERATDGKGRADRR